MKKTREALPQTEETLHKAPSSEQLPTIKERRDAAEHRRQILTVARTLFTEQGIDTVSMNQIAQAAGVGTGTLYRRYAHKGSLCEALLGESVRTLQDDFIQEQSTQDIPALTLVEHLLRRLICFNENHSALLSAIMDAATGTRRMEVYRNPFYSWVHQTIIALLQKAIQQGEAHISDVEYSAYLLFAPLVIDQYLYQRSVLGFSPDRIANGIQCSAMLR
jgi:AcrR family transcriptional regulator